MHIHMRGECKFSFSSIIMSDQGQSCGSFDKALVAEADDVNWIPRTCLVEEENQLLPVVLWSLHTWTHVHKINASIRILKHLFLLSVWMLWFHACLCTVPHVCLVHIRYQKRISDTLEMGWQMIVSHYVGAWKQNPGPVQEQYSHWTSEPSHQLCNERKSWSERVGGDCLLLGTSTQMLQPSLYS